MEIRPIWHRIFFLNYSSHFTITVKQEFYYMPNGPTYKIHNKKTHNFQWCWGKEKKMTKKIHKNFSNSAWVDSKLKKMLGLLPGSGETSLWSDPDEWFCCGWYQTTASQIPRTRWNRLFCRLTTKLGLYQTTLTRPTGKIYYHKL